MGANKKDRKYVRAIEDMILDSSISVYMILPNKVSSVVTNDGWVSFFGNYLGDIIGGIGTLLAVLIRTKHTETIQDEN